MLRTCSDVPPFGIFLLKQSYWRHIHHFTIFATCCRESNCHTFLYCKQYILLLSNLVIPHFYVKVGWITKNYHPLLQLSKAHLLILVLFGTHCSCSIIFSWSWMLILGKVHNKLTAPLFCFLFCVWLMMKLMSSWIYHKVCSEATPINSCTLSFNYRTSLVHHKSDWCLLLNMFGISWTLWADDLWFILTDNIWWTSRAFPHCFTWTSKDETVSCSELIVFFQ